MWDTYSAFANCYGGVIILGVKEDKSGNWHTTGLKNAAKLKKDFWDTVIMVIWVPGAKREPSTCRWIFAAVLLAKRDRRRSKDLFFNI